MTRRILLIPLLTVALVGFAKGQVPSEKKEDAIEVEKKEVLEFEHNREEASKSRDVERMAPFYADDFVFTSERFGIGEVFNKGQYLQFRATDKKTFTLVKGEHDITVVHILGNTVVLTGHSKTILNYYGKLSKGPRLFMFVFVKQDGRWQTLAMQLCDIPKGQKTAASTQAGDPSNH